MTDRLVTRTIVLPNGNRASLLLTDRAVDGREAQAALRLDAPNGVLILNGGTEEPREIDPRLRSLLQDGVAPAVLEQRLTVVTGGTDAGVFRLFGEALDGHTAAACIGVAPASLVDPATTAAGERESGGENGVPLEPHHTHFVLVEGAGWGDETDVMLSLADALSSGAPSLALLASGGSVSKREVLGHVRAGREVVVLAGSGRLADEITDVVTGRVTAGDTELAEIAGGRITVFDLRAPPAALGELVRARLGSAPRSKHTLRRLALFAPLPRLRWRPGKAVPFISESALARCPDLREEVVLLEHELVPRLSELDQQSLRTQNSFRLGQLVLIVGGAVASALGAVQAALGGGVVVLALLGALIAGVLAAATVYIRGRNAQREYFTARLRTERLRAEYFLVLAGAGEYAGLEHGERARTLRRRISAIETAGGTS